jgi:hypothetical protein
MLLGRFSNHQQEKKKNQPLNITKQRQERARALSDLRAMGEGDRNRVRPSEARRRDLAAQINHGPDLGLEPHGCGLRRRRITRLEPSSVPVPKLRSWISVPGPLVARIVMVVAISSSGLVGFPSPA